MKALIVEDDPASRTYMKDSVESQGQQTCAAEDGLKGLEVFREFKPKLVICDLKTPGMNGLELLKNICAVSSERRRAAKDPSSESLAGREDGPALGGLGIFIRREELPQDHGLQTFGFWKPPWAGRKSPVLTKRKRWLDNMRNCRLINFQRCLGQSPSMPRLTQRQVNSFSTIYPVP